MFHPDQIIDHGKEKIDEHISDHQISYKPEGRQVQHGMIPAQPVEDIYASSLHIRETIFIDKSSGCIASETTVFSILLPDFFLNPPVICRSFIFTPEANFAFYFICFIQFSLRKDKILFS